MRTRATAVRYVPVAVRVAGVLVTAVLIAAGCSPARSGSLGPAPTARPPASVPGPPSTSTAPPSRSSPPSGPTARDQAPDTPAPGGASPDAPRGTVTVQLWLSRDGRIVPAARTRPATLATSRLALTELVAGPTAVEAAAGIGSGLAPGTTFTIVGIAGGVETVRFPASFYSGGRDAARLRQAQVVYTLTQFPSVSRVGFTSDAGPQGAPVGRGDYADLLPAIVVTGPLAGQAVASPVVVTGTAEVYEATVNVRVLDAAGREVATTFTLATCGTGCRGDYRVAVAYRLATTQRGTVEVFELSPRDGSRINLVSVPVTLAAARQ